MVIWPVNERKPFALISDKIASFDPQFPSQRRSARQAKPT
jgi:hypothetical protein